MSKLKLFYPSLYDLVPSQRLQLSGPEHKHLRANRLKSGDLVDLFAANGDSIQVKVLASSASSSELEVVGHLALNKATSRGFSLTLAVAFPAESRGDLIIEKGTELGVSTFVPLVTKFSVLVPKAGDKVITRWTRLLVEATKQSLAPKVPTLTDPIGLSEFLQSQRSKYDWAAWGCMPSDTVYKPVPISASALSLAQAPKNALLFIGPEGDFSPQEKDALMASKCIPVTLSGNRLRSETASLSIVAIAADIFRSKPVQDCGRALRRPF